MHFVFVLGSHLEDLSVCTSKDFTTGKENKQKPKAFSSKAF